MERSTPMLHSRTFYELMVLRTHGVVHQRTCVNTPAQSGVAERKNWHLLEVARSLLFTMNVPKYMWGEAVLCATYLINMMPLPSLNNRASLQIFRGDSKFLVPPKVFGCVCFVHTRNPGDGKLSHRAKKCVFVGYTPDTKGYKCYCSIERKMYISKDVTFWESHSYFGSSPTGSSREGEP